MTTVIATIGPACDSVETLSQMIEAGMRVARMNFSHGDFAFHARMAGLVRAASEQTGIPVALLADLQGAKVRIGWIEHRGAGRRRLPGHPGRSRSRCARAPGRLGRKCGNFAGRL